MKTTILVLGVLSTVGSLEAASKRCQAYIPSLNMFCPRDKPGQSITYADPDHCSKYWECYDGCATYFQCQFDYLYDSERAWCNFADQVTCGDRDCDGRPCQDEQTTPEPGDFTCPSKSGYFADPANCVNFYICDEWRPQSMNCPVAPNGEQELYNPVKQWCDYPDRVDCGERPICNPDGTDCSTDGGHTTPPPDVCQTLECSDDGWFPEGDCSECVCQCSHGNAFEMCCGPGLVWNPTGQFCDYPGNVGCSQKKI